MGYDDRRNVSVLLSKTLSSVQQNGVEEIIFRVDENESYRMYHEQDCCENVTVEDVTGDLNDLVGSPILMAEETTNHTETEHDESSTWTFYKFATIKGYVTIRWLGESNGYYSESVDFELITNS